MNKNIKEDKIEQQWKELISRGGIIIEGWFCQYEIRQLKDCKTLVEFEKLRDEITKRVHTSMEATDPYNQISYDWFNETSADITDLWNKTKQE